MKTLRCSRCEGTDFDLGWTANHPWLKCKGCGFTLALDLSKEDRDYLEVMTCAVGKD